MVKGKERVNPLLVVVIVVITAVNAAATMGGVVQEDKEVSTIGHKSD